MRRDTLSPMTWYLFLVFVAPSSNLMAGDIDFPSDTDPALVTQLLKSTSRQAQQRGLLAAQQLSEVTPAIAADVVPYLKDGDPAFRSWAILCLKRLRDLGPDNLKLVSAALDDEDEVVRLNSAALLMAHGFCRERAVAALRKLATTAENKTVRSDAANALGKSDVEDQRPAPPPAPKQP